MAAEMNTDMGPELDSGHKRALNTDFADYTEVNGKRGIFNPKIHQIHEKD
jgi:hypothetical protein